MKRLAAVLVLALCAPALAQQGAVEDAFLQAFGGRVNARSATTGQALVKQADGSWAGGSGGTSLTGLGTDNRLARWDGTDTLQGSSVSLSDGGQLSWPTGLGAYVQILGPTDQALQISSSAGRDCYLSAPAGQQLSLSGPAGISITGHLIPSTNNLYDLGSAAGPSPRNVYAATAMESPILYVGGTLGTHNTAQCKVDNGGVTGVGTDNLRVLEGDASAFEDLMIRRFYACAGSAAAPSVTAIVDESGNISLVSGGQIAWYSGAVDLATLGGSVSGRLGLDTTDRLKVVNGANNALGELEVLKACFDADDNTFVSATATDKIGLTCGGTEYQRSSSAGWDTGATGLLGGSAIGTVDARFYRSTTKTWTLDDNAAGAATLNVVGAVTASTTVTAGTAFRAPNGSQSVPAYAFTNDSDTGWYEHQTGAWGWVSDGAIKMEIGAGVFGFDSAGVLRWANATGDPSTNYDVGLGRAAAGVLKVLNGTSGEGSLRVAAGDATSPSLSFISDTNTGFFNPTADTLDVTVGGTAYYRFDVFGIQISPSAGGLAFVSGLGSGDIYLKRGSAGILTLNDGNSGATSKKFVVQGTSETNVGTAVTLTDATATVVATFAMAADKACAGKIDYTILAVSGSGEDEIQTHSGTVYFSVYDNDGGAVAGTISEVECGGSSAQGAQGLSTGSLTHAWTIVDGTNAFTLKCNSDSSLTSPTITLKVTGIQWTGSSGVTLTSIP